MEKSQELIGCRVTKDIFCKAMDSALVIGIFNNLIEERADLILNKLDSINNLLCKIRNPSKNLVIIRNIYSKIDSIITELQEIKAYNDNAYNQYDDLMNCIINK